MVSMSDTPDGRTERVVKRGEPHDCVRTEAFYESLDPGIRFAVRVLHAAGYETGQSCEGGEGHAYDRPTIDLFGLGHSADGFGALHALSAYGLPVRDVSILWRIENGLPVEVFWRITFRQPMHDRANGLPSFVKSTQSQWIEKED